MQYVSMCVHLHSHRKQNVREDLKERGKPAMAREEGVSKLLPAIAVIACTAKQAVGLPCKHSLTLVYQASLLARLQLLSPSLIGILGPPNSHHQGNCNLKYKLTKFFKWRFG